MISLLSKVADIVAILYVVDGKTTKSVAIFVLADGIAMVEDVKSTQGVCVIGRCYCQWWLM